MTDQDLLGILAECSTGANELALLNNGYATREQLARLVEEGRIRHRIRRYSNPPGLEVNHYSIAD